MLDQKEIEQLKRRVKEYTNDGKVKNIKGKLENVEFFINNAEDSLNSAKALLEISKNKEIQQKINLADFKGYLWVINSSYYSMFYYVRALLEKEGFVIKTDLSIHLIVSDLLFYHFYLTGKLKTKLLEYFVEAKEEANEILGQEKAYKLVDDYLNEKKKRGQFTYEMGEVAMRSKAETSLKRALQFSEEIGNILK